MVMCVDEYLKDSNYAFGNRNFLQERMLIKLSKKLSRKQMVNFNNASTDFMQIWNKMHIVQTDRVLKRFQYVFNSHMQK